MTQLHEQTFYARASVQLTVNSVDSDYVMAWLLHHATLAGKSDLKTRKRFLDAGRELAKIYSYTDIAKRICLEKDIPD
jgi:hypothetical protein